MSGSDRARNGWFVARQGEIAGPVPEDQIMQWVQAGMTDAYVRPAESSEWLHVMQSHFVGALQQHAGPPPQNWAAQGRTIGKARLGGLASFGLTCVHFVRWCMAASMATLLAVALAATVCLSAPLSVMDSHDFWVTWASRSTALHGVQASIDEWFDHAHLALAKQKQDATVASVIGDGSLLADAMESARSEMHLLLSGEAVDAMLGLVTGRDDQLRIDLGIESLKRRAAEFATASFESRYCALGGETKPGCASRQLLEPTTREKVHRLVMGFLEANNPLSGRVLASVFPTETFYRYCFIGLRFLLAVTPVALGLLAAGVYVMSLRLRTAAFMFGCSAVSAGLGLLLVGTLAQQIAENLLGISDEVWTLAAEKSSAVQAGLGVDQVLLVLGATLLAGRVFGPSWRRSFWTRRLQSAHPQVVALATRRLSRPAGLLEPVHLLRAPKP